uniref:Uncharacterized protein n=1 Tax=Rhizophora mucronata TaxID=61149 RepID=A0A2P2KF02_RHIMU
MSSVLPFLIFYCQKEVLIFCQFNMPLVIWDTFSAICDAKLSTISELWMMIINNHHLSAEVAPF